MKLSDIEAGLKNAQILMDRHEYAEALSCLELLIDPLKSIESKKYHKAALSLMGICCYETQQLDKASSCLEEGLVYARDHGTPNEIADFLHELSMVAYK